jgi:agmatine deiminase
VAAAIARFEPVTVGASAAQWDCARALLPDPVRVVELASDDAWMRDVGPTFVVNGQGDRRGVDWTFNAWGGLYTPCDRDDAVAGKVLESVGADRYRCSRVLEGGAIHVDGEGTVIVTEECLLNPNRNPGLTQTQIEKILCDYLNVTTVIWLSRGVYMDLDTSGHVDNLCCYVRPGVVALTWTDDETDPQYAISIDAHRRLSQARDARGRALEVHKIHQPSPLFVSEAEASRDDDGVSFREPGQRLPASYINFYIANGGVVMPGFDDPHDRPALEAIQKLFPDRDVAQIYSREILLGGGNIHCITQQQPM